VSSPFSDTTSPSTAFPNEWEQAKRLADRLGLSTNDLHGGHFLRVLCAGVHSMLDRLEAAEKRIIELGQDDIARG
jgi:hypothetical protein